MTTLSPLTVLAPLGISPFLAVGLLGAAAEYGYVTLPPHLALAGHPVVWKALLGLAVALKLGRSFKLTKPLAEAAGTTESFTAVLALAGMLITPGALAAPETTSPLSASVLGTALVTVVAVTGLMAVIAVRMGFDLLTWLSPVPFIDGVLQLVKTGVTAVLVAVAVLLPPLAVVLNLALLLATVLAARWLVRIGRFGARLLWDGTFGRIGATAPPFGAEGVGPLPAYAVRSDCGLRRFCAVELRWREGAWTTDAPGGSGASIDLGRSGESAFSKGLLGTTLRTPRALLLVTPRYHRFLPRISERTGTPTMGSSGSAAPAMETGAA